MKIDIKNWFWLGFVSGIVLPFLTSILAKIVPSITLQFQQMSVLGAQTVTPGIATSSSVLGNYFVQLTQPFGASLPVYIISGIAGGLLVVLGAWIVSLPLTPNPKTAYGKVFAALFWAGLAVALWAMTGNAVEFLPVLFVLTLTSAVTAVLIVLLTKIIPGIIKVPSN